jgi:drug/metabolite transporter (DMT)-like permease
VAVLLGFLVAMAFGSGDFFGARASMHASTSAVLVVSQAVGVVGALVVTLSVSGRVAPHDIVLGASAGAATVIGLGLLYRGLATAAMGVVAPVTAVVAAAVPVTWGLAHGERPSAWVFAGIVLAVGAGALIAREPGARIDRLAPGVLAAAAAGATLGSSLVLFSETSSGSGMWPVFAARVAGFVVAVAAVAFFRTRHEIRFPPGDALVYSLVAGVLDVTATTLIVLAVREGMITVVAGVAALAPGFTVLLAWLVLREQLRVEQRIGIVVALVGLVLVAAG